MNLKLIPTRLAQLANLSEFARASGIPRRTLERVKADGIASAQHATLENIAQALKTHRPRKKS